MKLNSDGMKTSFFVLISGKQKITKVAPEIKLRKSKRTQQLEQAVVTVEGQRKRPLVEKNVTSSHHGRICEDSVSVILKFYF